MIRSKSFLVAVATLFGTTIGAGIFALPYVITKAGWIIGLLYFTVFGFIITVLQLMYGEVILRTKENHRLPGYTKKYLGPVWEKIVLMVEILGSYGGLLVYLILGGNFLFLVLGPLIGGSFGLYVFLFWIVFSLWVIRGLKLVANIELALDGLLILILLGIVIFGLPKFSLDNLNALSLREFLLPYGVILFALSGAIAIPEMKDELAHKKQLLKHAIILGTVLAMIISLAFGLAVAGVSGSETTPDALSGLRNFFGAGFVQWVALFGLLAIATSFLVAGVYLKDLLHFDLNFDKKLAGLLVVIVPMIAFGLNIGSFVGIIGFLGAVTVALSSIIIIFIFKTAKNKGDREPEYSIRVPMPFIIFLTTLFLLGFLNQIFFNL
ncbi:hypothetical protein C4553_00415 [Candidatus Parcubacteria bacterium]|nr:MAG: hypothetical protein C4553_00415 [Candidatus Parcubacteria bacterium]